LQHSLFPQVLKADFHLHTSSDERDKDISYSDKELIDEAARQGFSVLSFTFHDYCYYPLTLRNYAKKKGILLISGVEKTISGKHVLLINYPLKDIKKIEKLQEVSDLRNYLKNMKKADRAALLTVFAHPRFWLLGMGRTMFRQNIDLADAVEYQSFRHKVYDFNEDVLRLAKKYKKEVVGTTDMHTFDQFGHTYTLISSKKEPVAIIHAIKTGKTKIVSSPLSAIVIMKRLSRELKGTLLKIFKYGRA
jgi:predicted metal-dependent phosphoesterase TrpH